MEIQERYAVHTACAALLLISIATTVRAQTATDNTLPDAPDAAYMLTGASSPDPTAWGATSTFGFGFLRRGRRRPLR